MASPSRAKYVESNGENLRSEQAFVELCLRYRVMDDSPLAQNFLGRPQSLMG